MGASWSRRWAPSVLLLGAFCVPPVLPGPFPGQVLSSKRSCWLQGLRPEAARMPGFCVSVTWGSPKRLGGHLSNLQPVPPQGKPHLFQVRWKPEAFSNFPFASPCSPQPHIHGAGPPGEPGPFSHPWDEALPPPSISWSGCEGFAGAALLASILGCLGEESLSERSESPGWGGQPHLGGEGRAWFLCEAPLGLETWLPSRPRELGTRRRAVGKPRRWVQAGAGDAFVASVARARARPDSLRRQQGITHLEREARSLHHPRRGKPAVSSVLSLPVRLLGGGGRWPWVPLGAPSSRRGTQTLLPEVTLRMPTLLTTSPRTQHVPLRDPALLRRPLTSTIEQTQFLKIKTQGRVFK